MFLNIGTYCKSKIFLVTHKNFHDTKQPIDKFPLVRKSPNSQNFVFCTYLHTTFLRVKSHTVPLWFCKNVCKNFHFPRKNGQKVSFWKNLHFRENFSFCRNFCENQNFCNTVCPKVQFLQKWKYAVIQNFRHIFSFCEYDVFHGNPILGH